VKRSLLPRFAGIAAALCFSLGALAQPLPKVTIFFTGGTIASVYDAAKGGWISSIKAEDLLKAVPDMGKMARIDPVQAERINGTDMNPDYWRMLLKMVNEALAQPDTSGVIIVQGTDTIEETAYFMDLAVASRKPVIVTGAQRGATAPSPDGPRNLLDSVRVAISPEAVGKGALVVFNGEINAAREVTKTGTVANETFKSPELGFLGYVDPTQVRFYRAPTRRQTITIDPAATLGRVEIVPYYAGADGRLITGLLTQGGFDGLVVAGTGVGNVSTAMFEPIKKVREMKIPVVIGTRVHAGRVMPLYLTPGRGISLKEIGCVFADNLTPQKARILLMLALTRTRDSAELQKYFDHGKDRS
jgi:L-asparaginase